ncbi:MAG: hypothetical protein ACI4WX_11790 [Aristaeellaceae bacterium]
MAYAPHGQRECVNCTLYHPERPGRPCSAFGALENKNRDCSLYIEDRTPPDKRVLWIGNGGKQDEQ